MLTRVKTGKSKPKVFIVHTELTTIEYPCLNISGLNQCRLNITLLKNYTWNFTNLPPHKKYIVCKWIFKVRENTYGNINKYKASSYKKAFTNINPLISMKLFHL